MKKFVSTLFVFLAAKVSGNLPKGDYRISRKDYSGNRKKISEWCLIAKAGPQDSDGNFPLHVVNQSGIWDAIQSTYLTPTGQKCKYY